MSFLDCELLAFLHSKSQPVVIGEITKTKVDQYAILGSIGRLKIFGFIASYTGNFSIGGGVDNTLSDLAQITNCGKQFCDFALSNSKK